MQHQIKDRGNMNKTFKKKPLTNGRFLKLQVLTFCKKLVQDCVVKMTDFLNLGLSDLSVLNRYTF